MNIVLRPPCTQKATKRRDILPVDIVAAYASYHSNLVEQKRLKEKLERIDEEAKQAMRAIRYQKALLEKDQKRREEDYWGCHRVFSAETLLTDSDTYKKQLYIGPRPTKAKLPRGTLDRLGKLIKDLQSEDDVSTMLSYQRCARYARGRADVLSATSTECSDLSQLWESESGSSVGTVGQFGRSRKKRVYSAPCKTRSGKNKPPLNREEKQNTQRKGQSCFESRDKSVQPSTISQSKDPTFRDKQSTRVAWVGQADEENIDMMDRSFHQEEDNKLISHIPKNLWREMSLVSKPPNIIEDESRPMGKLQRESDIQPMETKQGASQVQSGNTNDLLVSSGSVNGVLLANVETKLEVVEEVSDRANFRLGQVISGDTKSKEMQSKKDLPNSMAKSQWAAGIGEFCDRSSPGSEQVTFEREMSNETQENKSYSAYNRNNRILSDESNFPEALIDGFDDTVLENLTKDLGNSAPMNEGEKFLLVEQKEMQGNQCSPMSPRKEMKEPETRTVTKKIEVTEKHSRNLQPSKAVQIRFVHHRSGRNSISELSKRRRKPLEPRTYKRLQNLRPSKETPPEGLTKSQSDPVEDYQEVQATALTVSKATRLKTEAHKKRRVSVFQKKSLAGTLFSGQKELENRMRNRVQGFLGKMEENDEPEK